MSDPACLRFPLAEYPGMSRFVLDWLGGGGEARAFLARDVVAPVRPPAARSEALAAALDASNRRWGLFVKDQLRAWAAGNSVAIVAGQQAGFAGGPLYTLTKLATLVRVRRELESKGIAATAFFWLATEDHDFNEVAQFSVPVSTVQRPGLNRQLDLVSIRAARSAENREAVGPQPVPEALIRELLALCPMPRPAWLRPGITFADSFAELVASVFGNEVVLVDSLLPELRMAGAGLFDRIVSNWSWLQSALRQRSAALQSAGYAPQVAPRDDGDYTLLFEIDDRGQRRVLEKPKQLPPERTSTSALTRPLLQDEVLRPAVFVGGPAEVAYYAQIAPLHLQLEVPEPRVALRAHALLAPKRVVRSISRFNLQGRELFTSADEFLAAREPEAVRAIRAEAEKGREELHARLERIAEIALPAEHALARALSRSVGHVEYHFEKLTERAIRAVVRKDRERWTAARNVVSTLYPDRKVQDRVASWFPWWLEHGGSLAERLVSEVEPDSDHFKVISI
jgi:uncharacterized protein YllA (UPF0747 family)